MPKQKTAKPITIKKQKIEKPITVKKDLYFLFLGFLPVLRIRHKIGVVEEKEQKFVRLSKMYWLFCFFPLFKTERDWEE